MFTIFTQLCCLCKFITYTYCIYLCFLIWKDAELYIQQAVVFIEDAIQVKTNKKSVVKV